MIICPNCNTQNSPLNVKCSKCGSFIQARVPNLDLFETVWQIIEKPLPTFRKICLSEQKNYVYALFSFFGIGLLFASFWYINLGNRMPSLLEILIFGLLGGPFAGVIALLSLSWLLFLVSKYIFRKSGKFRNLLSVTAYSSSPVVISVIFVLPVELIVFGLYLFTNNPSAQVLKPLPFYVLITLDGVVALYSMVLFTLGIKVANEMSLIKSIIVSLICLVIFIFGIFLLLTFIKNVI
jgi:hypothetical protein